MIADTGLTDAPDWSQVPFDVTCSRCGHALQGLTEPKCPSCTLEFEWSDVLPITELQCPNCDYNLWGLRDLRCPECGSVFAWDEVFAARFARELPFFEYQWRRRPVQSFFASEIWSMRPRRLWSRVDLHDRPPIQPLLALSALNLALAMKGTITLVAVALWFINPPMIQAPNGRWMQGTLRIGDLWQSFIETSGAKESWVVFLAAAGWAVLSLGALFLFRESMRQYKVRASHVVRVWAYAVVAPLPWLVFGLGVWVAGIWLTRGIDRWPLMWLIRDFMEEFGGIVVLFVTWVLVLWSITCAYKRYLKMDHPLGVAFASQMIAVLAAFTFFVAQAPF